MRMRSVRVFLVLPVVTLMVTGGLVAAGPAVGAAASGGRPAASGPVHARITGRPIPGTGGWRSLPASAAAASPVPSKTKQEKVLDAAYRYMVANYKQFRGDTPGPADVIDYGVGRLWAKGIDGAGTTAAVIEGWDDPSIASVVASFDKTFHLPNPQIRTIFPAGKLPSKCPAGMVALGGYGSCSAWQGELELDVISVHLMAPYAKIVISATPADQQVPEDAASQVAPPEMMKALEVLSSKHLANTISISDGTGEVTYSHGQEEITAQDPGELAAASAGIPVLNATGDCGVVQNLAVANGQCEDVSSGPDTATWDDSPWVTAVGGSVPNLTATGKRMGPDPLWHAGAFSPGAGFSAVYGRPTYQSDVAHITRNPMRSVPDITMDASNGTSEAAPLMSGILALATQANGGRDIGPINTALYDVLGPKGTADGIADVVKGNDNAEVDGKLVPGFSAHKGFDVASGWGTVYAPKFVPALVAATSAADEDRALRQEAAGQLAVLRQAIRISPEGETSGEADYVEASGFIPDHPVTVTIGGRRLATVTADTLGTVTYVIRPSELGLRAGRHTIRFGSMLIAVSGSFTVR
jgi:hypothetical protein